MEHSRSPHDPGAPSAPRRAGGLAGRRAGDLSLGSVGNVALFRDRREAGRALAGKLRGHANRPGRVVLALPRGGVPVAFEVARELHAPLDVFVVRKLGLPGHEELAMGALATGGVRVVNHDLVRALRLPETVVEAVTARECR